MNKLYTATVDHWRAKRSEAIATLDIYFNNSVGIGEHPQHIEEMDKLISTMVDANDKLELLEKKFKMYSAEQPNRQ